MIDLNIIGIGADTSEVRTANKDLDGFGKSADKASRQADGLTGSITSMAKGFLGVSAGIAAASKLVSVTDEYTKYTAILRNATSGQGEFNAALADIRRIANTAQTDVAGLATTYARFSGALKEFGASQKQIATLTETVALGLKANGASAQETSATMLQLSQAFGAGKLSGDEFRSMAEAAPNLMRALAASIGVPTGALKEMAAQGELTNDILLKAFTDPKLSAALQKQANDIHTISGAWQRLKNEIVTDVVEIDRALGASSGVAKFIEQFTTGIQVMSGKPPEGSYIDILTKFATSQGEKVLNFFGKLSKAQSEAAKTAAENGMFGGQNPITYGGAIGPNFANNGVVDVNKLHKRQEEERKAIEEINRLRQAASKEAAEKERQLRDAESAWRAKRDNDYQDELRKSWEANEKEKAKMAEDLAKEKQKADERRLDELSKQAQKNYEIAQREAEKQAEAVQREYDKINEALGRSLTDALMRGFESGKSFAQNFIDTLKNAFKTLVLQPAIEFVLRGSGISGALAGLGGLFSGNAGAADVYGTSGISGTGGIGGGYDLVKGITRGFDGLNSTFQSSIEDLGAWLAESNYGLIKDLGGMIGQYSTQIAKVAPYAGSILQLLSGDVKGAAFTGAGTAIGSYFGGPVGGAIGSFVGSAVGSLFGGKKKIPRFSSQSDTLFNGGDFITKSFTPMYKALNATGQTSSLNEAYFKALSPLFSAFDIEDQLTSASTQIVQKRKASYGNFNAVINGQNLFSGANGSAKSTQKTFEQLVNTVLTNGISKAITASTLPEGLKKLFDGLTEQSQVANMINAVINLESAQTELANRFGLTASQAGLVAQQSGLAGDSLAQFAASLASSALATQKSSVTMIKERDALKELIGSMPTSVDAFDLMLKAINTTTAEGQAQFAELFQLRQRFATYTGSFDAVVSNVESALYGMLSPSEKLALDQANLAAAFGELNIAVPGSIQELINLGKSIDYTTESGLDLALAFPALVDMFGKTQDAVNALTADLSANYFSTLADFRSAQVSDSPQSYIKNQTQINADLLAEIQAMKQDSEQQKAVLLTVAEYTFKQSRVLDDWDANGMPAVRTE